MNPALSQQFHLFCEEEHPQKRANTDKNPYCVYGTLKNQILILQRHSRRHMFFLGGCQGTFLPHGIHHSSFTRYSLHTTVCCSGTAGNKVHLVHFQLLPYYVYSSCTAVRTACGIVARTATQPTRSTLRTLGVKVLPLLLTAGLSPPLL